MIVFLVASYIGQKVNIRLARILQEIYSCGPQMTKLFWKKTKQSVFSENPYLIFLLKYNMTQEQG